MILRATNFLPVTTSCNALMMSGLLVFVPAVMADEALLLDDFSGPVLDVSTWGLATWNIGDRTQFGNRPQFGSDGVNHWIELPLDTYNPAAPGQRVLGTEIFSLQNFPVSAGGIEYLARARLTTGQPGLVAAFFTYNQKRSKGRWISDEIDFEVLSSQPSSDVLVTSWDDWGAAGSDYYNGIHHDGEYLDLSAQNYNWQDWNDYAMRWYPDRVEWYVNGILVHQQTAPVPDQDQPVRASLWAGGTTWPEAYSPDLVIASSAEQNQHFVWQVDYIMVTDLGGGSGGSAPNAPTGLAATVNGNQVQLGWQDNSSNELGFRVYRAWKP
ncbi:MAG TPA: glycoside hydrolase family 16 protein, partial [Xanthomonadales bacterium]|nr:glycoside hydrolase family 16 protein [Xanthomonadales bacterium]